MQVRGYAEVVAGIRQADLQRVRLAQALVRFEERDQLSEDLRDVGAVDLVDDQNEGFRLGRTFSLLAVQVALERRDVELFFKGSIRDT